MKTKFQIVICVCLLFAGCATTYKPQPIVIKDLSTNPDAVSIADLKFHAETYQSNTGVDLSKAALHGIMLNIQRDIYGDKGTPVEVSQFDYGDIVGVGDNIYMPYLPEDVFVKMSNSAIVKESIKGAAVGVGAGAAAGAVIGAIIGAIAGDAGTGALYGAGSVVSLGGSSGFKAYREKLKEALTLETKNRSITFPILVERRAVGVLWFPYDVHTIEINYDGAIKRISVTKSSVNPKSTVKLAKKMNWK